MEVYFWAFITFEQNNWVKLLPMAKFAYNNAKNTSIDFISFKLNCDYHLRISYKKEVNSYFKSQLADKLLVELRKLIIVYQENLHHTQKLQKQVHNKEVKPQCYSLGDQV